MKSKIITIGIITAITGFVFLTAGCNPLSGAEWKLNKSHIPLTENVWTNGNINYGEEVWYSLPSVRGPNIWWNDSRAGDETKDADIRVKVYYSDKSSGGEIDSGWDTPANCSSSRGKTIYLRVTASNSGTFAITYNFRDFRPGRGTVTFDINGGTGTVPAAQTEENGTVITLPDGSDLSMSGYTFGGWNTMVKEGTGTFYDAGSYFTVHGNITLYADWYIPYTITITYMDAGGGAFSGTHGSDYPTTHTYGTATTLGSPTKSGYVFVGWFENSGGTGTARKSLSARGYTASITLYAKWMTGIVSPTGHVLVQIPAGTFKMGSPANEPGRNSEGGTETQHQVTLTKGFYMGKYPVTQAQYEAVMGTNPSGHTYPVYPETSTANHPVKSVSWYDAIVFCNKLSMQEGLTPAYRIKGSTDPAVWGPVPPSDDSWIPVNDNSAWEAVTIVSDSTGYRLPTEAQWEYACRAGTTTAYNTGDTISEDTGWYRDNSDSRTHEVGLKQVNAWGLYDMLGNVNEWCWDWYGWYSSGAQTDPTGPDSGISRILRGGEYWSHAPDLRSARRGDHAPHFAYHGFRLSRPAQ